MNDRIRQKVEELFASAPRNKKVQELKEEMISNLEEKYQDLITCGKNEEEAFDITIASIGDIDELIRSMSGSEGIYYQKQTAPKQNVSLEKTKDINLEEKRENAYEAKKEPAKKTPVVTLTILACLGALIIKIVFGVMPRMHDGMWHMPSVTTNDPVFGEDNLVVAKEETQKMNDVEKIKAILHDADVTVSVWDKNEIKVIESTTDPQKKDLFNMNKSKDTIEIMRPKRMSGFILGDSKYHKVEIFIPESYKEKLEIETSSGDIDLLDEIRLDTLEVATASGDVKSDSLLELEKFKSETSSGSSHYASVQTESYELKSASGDIQIKSLTGEGKVSTASGCISAGSISGESHEIATNSGDIAVTEGHGDFKIKTSSGSKNIGKLIGDEHELEASSGDVEIEELEGECSLSSASGYVKCGKYKGDKLEVSTNSGNVEITEMQGAYDITTASGNVTLNILSLTDDAKIKTNSGDVNLSKEGEVNAAFSIETTSGDIDGSDDIVYTDEKEHKATLGWGKGNEVKVNIKTTSGRVEIED